MNKVRWGLLSTANINRKLIPAIRESERGILTAIASRTQDIADSYAAEWEIPVAFGSYESMLASDQIDAVYIGLPNHLHVPWTLNALDAGKHVLCEKPFTISLEEVDQVIQRANETGLVVAEAFMYRHHPQTKIVGEWIESGRLGEILVVNGVFNFKLDDPENVRLDPEFGGGSLWDVGVYPVSLAQYVMGEAPEWVHGDQRQGETGVDMLFSGQMHYSNRRMALFSSSFWSPFHTHFEIIGTEGRLEMKRPFVEMDYGQYLTFFPAEGEPVPILVFEKDLYLGEVQDMHNAILNGWMSYISLEETRDHIRTILALYESAGTGEVVHLE
jgi:predicted dehydrogenase